ncbi:hypothetical protein LCGC14_1598610 [marine sediment metagenome]|uniref:Photosynthesis system II assembly factor Ycf48/Hcf136-like domain-containing protein n=1 Tax=marine sediment metagenome TaxID=412755 RepID=A0A0F9IC92_9ZZZZ
MTTAQQLLNNDLSRVWLTPFSAGPANQPSYEGLARADTPEWALGDITPIHIPDPDSYGRFLVAGVTRGTQALPTLTIMWRYTLNRASALDRIVRNGCDHDIQIHMGECQDPQSFNQGWEKILLLEKGTATNWSTSQIGTLQPDERALVNEEVPFTGRQIYHIYRMVYEEQATSEIVQEVIDVVICDSVTCGACGIPSNGCDRVLALTLTAGGSPGLPAEIIFSADGGLTYSDTNITTLAANEDPNEFACVGINLVVVSEDSESLHFAPIADIFAGTEVWTQVTTGFVAANGPLAIHAESPRHVWIVAENGYIYFSSDITASVVVQDAGVATIQDLLSVHAYDILNVVAVGVSNAVVVTRNGGDTWSALTGPNPGVTLNTIWMRGPDEWLVGDAGGQLWYTLDGGANWTEKTFPGSGGGAVQDIHFATNSVGFMAHDTAASAGRILRTIDGGVSWYVVPEGNTLVPTSDRINMVAPCINDPNIMWAGGLADNATDGILIKGADGAGTL